MPNCCKQCGRVLRRDEIGLYRRLVNRGAEEFLCIDCLSARIGCPKELLHEKIEHFKSIGCTLFL